MSTAVFAAVLGAAALHASWNAIAKAIPDQRVAAGLMALVGLVLGAVGAAVLPLPLPASWPFLVVSSILQAAYLLLLVHAYRYGEFSQVYPLARGLPPVLVTAFALVVLDERLTATQLAGVLVVSLALAALVCSRGWPRAGSGLGLAALTGLVIAAYSILDGVGVRRAGHPLSYGMWLFLLQGPLVVGVARLRYGRGFSAALARSFALGALGGGLALVAYAVVLWAQSQAPLALVAALRETSLLFAGLIGVLVFRERLGPVRLLATAGAVAGMVLLRAASLP